MNLGKISESVYKRSILKIIHTTGYQEEILDGAGLGADCAILASENRLLVTGQSLAAGQDTGLGSRAVCMAVNRTAVSGAKAAAAILHITLPESYEEVWLREMMQLTVKAAEELQIKITDVQAEVAAGLQRAAVTAFVTAYADKDACLFRGKAKAGQDVIMTKWIGLEGTSQIAKLKGEELLTRYPQSIVEEAKTFDSFLSITPEAATGAANAVKSGVSAMHVVREGGIFGALWEFAQCSGVGLVIDLKKIPVRQETIEVCEFYDINPYELLSGGSLLIAADNGMDLLFRLEQHGIAAAVIGKTTDSNDRILMNEEERRFLEPARHDEIYKVL